LQDDFNDVNHKDKVEIAIEGKDIILLFWELCIWEGIWNTKFCMGCLKTNKNKYKCKNVYEHLYFAEIVLKLNLFGL
jgi:hypothetical protein